MKQKIKHTILIVHENPEMRDLFLQLFGRDDFELYGAADKDQTIDIVQKKRIELIFLDMHLAGTNSDEMMGILNKNNPTLKIIVLTSDKDRDAKSHVMKLGAYGYLMKPFELGTVLKMVERAFDITLAPRTAQPLEEQDNRAIFEQAFSYRIPLAEKKYFIALVFVCIITVLLVGSGLLGFYYYRSDKTYRTPYANPTAITYDGAMVWVSDWVTQSFYRHDVKKLCSVNTVIYVQESHPTGLAYDGQTIWSCNAWKNKIYQHRIDSSFSIIAEYNSPGKYPSGLYWDGLYLWICDMRTKKIYKTTVAENVLTIQHEYAFPYYELVGMFSDGTHFWTADAKTGRILKHAFDNELTVIGQYQAAAYATGRERLTGMTWDGKDIWTCSEGTHSLFKHHFNNLKKINY